MFCSPSLQVVILCTDLRTSLFLQYLCCLTCFVRILCPKNTEISNFMKIRTVGAELFHANERTDRQTDRDMTKLIVGFRNSANGPKNVETSPSNIFKVFVTAKIHIWSLLLVWQRLVWYEVGGGNVLHSAAGFTDSEGSAFIRNADGDLPNCTVSHPRRP
jgi:hypothetical protein